ncbi:MAG: GNAT family N-acetyltransferase [Proteobacteria bacterium]|nr:GNAT family N-acetyltransferase [Pseudomonadota bacterium]
MAKSGDRQGRSMTAEEALDLINPKGSRVFVGSGCGEPQYLVEKLLERAQTLYDVEIVQALSTRAPGFTTEKLGQHFKVKTFFMAARGAREALMEGRADYIPVFMSQVPRLFSENRLELDCALVQVSPPDDHGYMSLGVAVDVAKEAVGAAALVIAQVNPRMPVTLGDSFIHVSEADALVEQDEPLLEAPDPVLDETDLLVGGNVARLVEDGSTIHAGLGRLPKAALAAMKNKTDLGVHTDMLTDAYLDLIRAGVITNRRKEYHRNRIVASYCLGTRELFRFVHMNPFVEFYPIAYTNDPERIGRHHRMVSIHEAMEVDLSGQICAAGIGHKVYSGVGSLVDFLRGASRSDRGRFIVALRSTSEDGRESRIVATPSPGSDLIGSRASVQYVVTEFGSVNLQAKSLHERSVGLIEIAHPRFREALYNQARDLGLLSRGDPISLFRPVVYPHHLERTIEQGGEPFMVRPAKATDIRAIQEFFYGLNDQDVRFRFLRTMKAFPREAIAAMAAPDYHNRMTLLVLKGEVGFERVVAVGRYMAIDQGDMVEVDVAVADDHRRVGLGRRLMKLVYEAAESRGFKGVMAFVSHDNPKTLQMIKNFGYKARARLDHGVFEIEMMFDEKTDEPYFEIIYPEPA